ncbi:hypothetical protein T06_2131 [Trichinella sp. T6]|nr:hypothetical protein T06_2131 [Trichinella sp. T6]
MKVNNDTQKAKKAFCDCLEVNVTDHFPAGFNTSSIELFH